MKRLFISQPMDGLTDSDILGTREILHKRAEDIMGEKLILIDSFIEETPSAFYTHIPVWYLAKSIELLSTADVILMARGWENARGCKIECDVAKAYGIYIIQEL